MSQSSQKTGGPIQLSSRNQKNGNDPLGDLDEKMKLSTNSSQHGEEGRDQEQNKRALWSAMWKTLERLANKEY